jgi:hypothetical protein
VKVCVVTEFCPIIIERVRSESAIQPLIRILMFENEGVNQCIICTISDNVLIICQCLRDFFNKNAIWSASNCTFGLNVVTKQTLIVLKK